MIGWSDLTSLAGLWAVFVGLVGVGVVLARRSYRAYRQHRSSPMLLLASGMGLLTIGMPVAWTSAYMLSEDMFLCTVSSALVTFVGAGLLLVSIQLRTS